MPKAATAKIENVPVEIEQDIVSYVPAVDENYYKWGNFDTVLSVINSKQFYPLWITGLSGNGKTQMIEQACAQAGREFIRVNFTLETDENDLIGGFRLINGNTAFHEGPVISALRRGAILLLDEIDIGHTNKIMCLQSVLEGKGVLIKATGEFVKPAHGFNVFATSNTKGQGSEDGRFIGANMMNGAFLDRFAGMLFQEYPPKDIEEFILKRYYISYVWRDKKSEDDITDVEMADAGKFIAKLCEWSNDIRANFEQGTTTEVITTRTLINIVQGYSILKDKKKAITVACERYNQATKEVFISFYEKLDDSVFVDADEKKNVKVSEDDEHQTYS